jgi:hypothetical protein
MADEADRTKRATFFFNMTVPKAVGLTGNFVGNRRCAQELCDDWFWLERRSCWNWGYGG